ncbi:3D domain-containing protein [Effusibacillus pohliae]|uniref:3D domain-containing protein n=1 Tax=Effusibacillus pohliae TaxID=232270 RepID=UPI0003630766|nr:3D domain-containing protein [Effusibacillus pohliae]
MKKWASICMLGILLAVSLLLQPFAAVSLAKEQCDCENESLTVADSSQKPAGDLLASRSGVANSNDQFVTYSVKQGDTLYQLAQQFSTDIQTLIALNNVTDPRFLQVGQTLTIPKHLSQQEIPAVTGIDKILTVTLTAYTSGPESTGKYPGHPAYGITSTGKRATEGRTIAVDPRIIPYGSKVYIEGVGIRTAEDTGGAIKGNRIDVYMEDVGQAIRFGVKKNVRVYVLSSPNS